VDKVRPEVHWRTVGAIGYFRQKSSARPSAGRASSLLLSGLVKNAMLPDPAVRNVPVHLITDQATLKRHPFMDSDSMPHPEF
jgi:hypothetical protein